VFVDREADLEMATSIIFNAKCQRPSTCNAAETLLVDWPIAAEFLPKAATQLWEKNVELRVDTPVRTVLAMKATPPEGKLVNAKPDDWSTEYNDYILNVKVVDGVADAIAHITRYGSAHSDAIVTRNETTARRFLNEVDSATVYWNASTRFTDGGEYGMGAEIGISTDKLGARGPMGLDELCTYKWLGIGNGQIRG
jgi:glutamate-5-semialdehyde dehydrogenase